MDDYLSDACERVDACMFTGDVMESETSRKEFREYVERWQRQLDLYEEKVQSKGHVAWVGFPNTDCEHELYLAESGCLMMAAEGNIIAADTRQRHGRWECYAKDVDDRLHMLKQHSVKWDQS